MGFGVWGLGFGVGVGGWGLGVGGWGFGVWGLGFGVWGLGLAISGAFHFFGILKTLESFMAIEPHMPYHAFVFLEAARPARTIDLLTESHPKKLADVVAILPLRRGYQGYFAAGFFTVACWATLPGQSVGDFVGCSGGMRHTGQETGRREWLTQI